MPSQVLAILGFDIDSDGQKELILSLADGTLEVRRLDTGDPIAKESFPSPVTALLVADYRMDGTNALICCSQNGEIRCVVYIALDGQLLPVRRAYLPVAPSEMAASVAALLPSGATSTVSTDARQARKRLPLPATLSLPRAHVGIPLPRHTEHRRHGRKERRPIGRHCYHWPWHQHRGPASPASPAAPGTRQRGAGARGERRPAQGARPAGRPHPDQH